MVNAVPGGSILEIGTYCGYSALRMAMALPGARVVSLEVDPAHMVIARNMVAYAGMAHMIDIWTGHSKDVLPRLPQRYGGRHQFRLGGVFMDQKGSRDSEFASEIFWCFSCLASSWPRGGQVCRSCGSVWVLGLGLSRVGGDPTQGYHEDLSVIEQLGLLLPGAVVVADNVLKPGSPLFLWRLCKGSAYDNHIVRVKEFAMPSEASWVGDNASHSLSTKTPWAVDSTATVMFLAVHHEAVCR